MNAENPVFPACGLSATAPFSQQELASIAAGAATLEERFRGDVEPAEESPGPAAEALLESWREAAGGGDAETFARVLSAYGVTQDAALRVLGPVRWRPNQPLPEWVDLFSDIATTLYGDVETATRVRLAPEGAPLPFEGLFYPLVAAARRWRDARVDNADLTLFSEAALTELDRSLLLPLTSLFARALNDRISSQSAAGLYTGLPGAEAIELFVAGLRGEKLNSLFLERPVLARLAAAVTRNWIEASAEFIARVGDDMDGAIADLAAKGPSPCWVEGLGIGLSDPHNGGRSVIRVTFDTGLTLAYKPKDLGADSAFRSLLDWLQARGAPASAGPVPTIARLGYGWSAWIEGRDCENRQEAQTFYTRSGAMLALLRVLQGNDFHCENVIADGPVPTPVDLETVMHPRVRPGAATDDAHGALIDAGAHLQDSVLAVGLLPQWLALAGGALVRSGGLDGAGQVVGGSERPDPRVSQPRANVPKLNGAALRVADFEEDFVAGYRQMFAFLHRNAVALTMEGGPLSAFEGVTVRPVLRATQVYALLHSRAQGRKATVNGAAWSLHFDYLCRDLFAEGVRPDHAAAVLRHERRALSQFDIPAYSASCESDTLVCPGGERLDGYFTGACLGLVRERLLRLDMRMLRRDEVHIRQALAVGKPRPLAGIRGPEHSDHAVTPDLLVAHAHQLACRLRDASVRRGDAAGFVAPMPMGSDERAQQITILDGGFLSGTLGIATFHAAVHALTGEPTLREEAHRLRRFADLMSGPVMGQIKTGRSSNLGLANGAGGRIYGLLALAAFLGAPEYADCAEATARSIPATAIASDRNFSLYGGTAGLLLALVALARRGRSAREIAAPMIDACRRHLAENRRGTAETGAYWMHPGAHVGLAGLLQGSAGIAIALAEAGDAESARDALIHETAALTSDGGCVDLRDATGCPSAAYSYGSAGLLLAQTRVGGLGISTETAVGDLLVGSVRDGCVTPTDDLVSGTFGRLFALSETGAAVAPSVGVRLADARRRGHFAWRAGADGDNPGLLTGAAGVGLVLLRLAAPDRVPAIAAFDTNLAAT